jgi:threonine synthase
MSKPTKRIVLPSGKTIEVVYFEHEVERIRTIEEAPQARQQDGPLDLHLCPKCEKDRVFPVEWDEHDDEHWEMTLRCPDCEHWQVVIAPQIDCEEFDDKLEDGHDRLVRDYKRLLTANLAEEIERFSTALRGRPHPALRLLGVRSCNRR